MSFTGDWGNRYWPIFLIASAVYLLIFFGIPEASAIIVHPSSGIDNTLSHYARTELHVSVATQNTIHTIAWWCSFVVWMMFVIFITAHIWFYQFG